MLTITGHDLTMVFCGMGIAIPLVAMLYELQFYLERNLERDETDRMLTRLNSALEDNREAERHAHPRFQARSQDWKADGVPQALIDLPGYREA